MPPKKKSADNAPAESPDTGAQQGAPGVQGALPVGHPNSSTVAPHEGLMPELQPAAVGDPIETPSLFRRTALEPVKAAGDGGVKAPEGGVVFVIKDKTDTAELLGVRGRIDALLPPRSIGEMNLEEELIFQYHIAKAMMIEAQNDTAVPTNQRAQVVNSCAAILKTLADAQIEVYNAERTKAIESALERAFVGVEEKTKKAFFERYQRLVRDAAAQKDSRNQQFLREKPQNSGQSP